MNYFAIERPASQIYRSWDLPFHILSKYYPGRTVSKTYKGATGINHNLAQVYQATSQFLISDPPQKFHPGKPGKSVQYILSFKSLLEPTFNKIFEPHSVLLRCFEISMLPPKNFLMFFTLN